MNKEYIYIDGKAIVTNDDGIQEPIEYCNNLDEILAQENLIETMENEIAELERKSDVYKKHNIKHYFPLTTTLTAALIGVIPLIFFFFDGINPYTTPIDIGIGTISEAGVIMTLGAAVGLAFTLPIEIGNYANYKNNKKHVKGINNELEYLKKQIAIERQTLETLKKNKQNKKEEQEFKVVQVNDKEKLNELKNYLNLCYSLGYSEKKLFDYYQQGTLDTKLKDQYNTTEIEFAKQYLEEKGHQLVNRKRRR